MANVAEMSLKATGTSTTRTFGARFADVINVKDYGAVGDGVANDGPAIQAALDAAYGSAASPNASRFSNKGVYIPRGTYLIGQQLTFAPSGSGFSGQGGWLFGDGQHATRLVYTGANTGLFGTTALLTTQFLNYSQVQGIAFDVTGSNAKCAVHNADITGGSSGGTGVTWSDCAFIGATSWGLLYDMSSTGSEQLFIGCTFSGCTGVTSNLTDHDGNTVGGGLVLASANALDHIVIGCRFTDNGCGILAINGGVNLIRGCTFHNNATIDIWIRQQNPAPIVGCYSDSGTFCCAGPAWIVGCTHTTASGLFYDGTGKYSQDNPTVTIEGCSVPNAVIQANSGCFFYLRGNTFGNGSYLSGVPGPSVRENI